MRLQSVPVALVLAMATPAFADDVLQQAEALISQQRAGEAAQLLEPLEETRAGDPAYDYDLGLALLESGEPSKAVFAFERCLAVDPRHGPCRVQMARTHLAMGEAPNARAELETIQSYNPPPEVKALVTQYLGAVANLERREKEQLNVYLQLGTGFDSNINSATDQKQIAIPAFNNTLFNLSASSQKQDSPLIQGLLSANYAYRLNPTLTALAEGNAQFRNYADNSDYSYLTADVAGGAALQQGPNQYIGKLLLQKMWLGGDAYRDVSGLLGQYQRAFADNAQIAVFAQLNQMRYDTQTSRDANRSSLGAAYSRAFDMNYSPVLYASAYVGQERTRDSAFDAYSQDFHGLRSGGSLQLGSTLKFTGGLSVEQRKFKANFPLYTQPRDEKEYDLNLGLAWRMAPDMTIVPAYTFTKNSSNIVLTDYTRHVLSIDVRIDL